MNSFDLSVNGLRGVAVLAVIAFHFGVYPITGGFVGVDVFFVLSGFVITASIMRQFENKSFSARRYLKSRFYRIYPALLVCIFVTLFLSGVWLFPSDAQRSAWHGLAAMGSVSNFLFWKEVGYFDADSHYKPFLHTWSLAVEWQFYLLWPLAVYVLFLLRRFSLYLAWVGVVGGLLLSALLVDYSNFVFYMMPLRGWEFALGGIVALTPSTHFMRQNLAFPSMVFGFGALIASVLLYDEDTLFPGIAAALPCFGAFALLFFNRKYSEKPLSFLPLQYCGTVSYSLYLVHWPVLILYQHAVFRPLFWWDIVVMSLITLVVSHISYAYIEQPFRRRDGLSGRVRLLILITVTAASGLIIWQTISTEGKLYRYGARENALIDCFADVNAQYRERYGEHFPKNEGDVWRQDQHAGLPCLYDNQMPQNTADTAIAGCIINNVSSQSDKDVQMLIVGDSNGKNIYEVFQRAYPDLGFSMLMHSGCVAAEQGKCFPYLKSQLSYIFDNSDIDGVILSSRFSNQSLDGLDATLLFLQKKNVPFLIVGATPTLLRTPDMIMLKKGLGLDDPEFILPLNATYYYDDIYHIDNQLEEMSRDYDGFFFNKKSYLCPDNMCHIIRSDYETPLFLDTNHLGDSGIGLLSQSIKENVETGQFLLKFGYSK